MKNFLTVLLMISCTLCSGQIYFGVDAGAKWNYNKLGGEKTDVKSTPEVSVKGGIKSGYNIEDKLQLEIAIGYSNYKVGFKFKNPTVQFSHNALSSLYTSLRVKPQIFKQGPMKIFGTLGLTPTFITSSQTSTPWDSVFVADGTGDSLILSSSANYKLKKSFLAFEMGISLEYELKNNLVFTSNLMAQTSFSDIMRTDLYYSRNGGSENLTSLTSKGLNTFFEIGLVYYLRP